MIVVTDTSVILNLCWLRQEALLSAIYEDRSRLCAAALAGC